MTAAEIIAEWDAKYERVNTDNTLRINGHDACSDMVDCLRTLLQRRPFGSYKVCCVTNPFGGPDDFDDDTFSELERLLDGPDFQNVGWIIPAGDARFDPMDMAMVVYLEP